MTSRRNRITALLLSFMMIALNLFSGTEALYSYADTDADSQTTTEETTDTEQAEDIADAEEEEQAETPEEEAAPAEEAAQEEAAPVEEAEEAEEEVAFSDEETLDGVTIKVTADEGVFPEGAQLEVRDLTAKEEKDAKKAINEITDEKADTEYLFDISVQKDGKEIEPEGDVKVSFETEEVADDNLKAEVIHVKDNGEAEELAVETKGEVATAETDSFSPYSLRFTNTAGTAEYDLVMDGTVYLSAVLDAIGRSDEHYNIKNITSNSSVVSTQYEERTRWVVDDWVSYNDYVITATGADATGEHSIDVRFYDNTSIVVVIKTHVHSWNLQTEDGTAMLKCTAEGCPHSQYTWTLTAKDVTYDGQGHQATLRVSPTPIGTDVSVGDIVYYKGSSSTPMSGYPTNAGTYTAKVTIDPDNGTHADAKTISASFTINKADITVTAPPAIPNLEYSRAWQNLHSAGSAKSATTSQEFTMKYAKGTSEAATESYDTAIEQGFNAGDYWIWYYVPGDDNHNASTPAKIQATIGKKPVVVQNIIGINKVYDGTDAATVDVSGATFEGKIAGDGLTISAAAKFRSDDTATPKLVGKDAGTNKVIDLTLTFGGTDKDNYELNAAASQKNARADITPKDVEASWDEATALQYNGEYQAPIADLMVSEEINDNDKKIYAIDKDAVSVTVTGKEKNVGTNYKAYVGDLVGDEAGNYNLINKNTPAEFSIIPKELTVVWTVIEKEYNAVGLEPDWSLTGFVGEEAPTKTLTLTANPTPLKDGTAYNAGKYQATVTLSGEDAGNYTITNPTSDFTITKAPLTVKAKGWVYYGAHVDSKSNDWINELEYDKDGTTGFKGDDGTDVLTAIEEGTVRFDTNYEFTDPATGVTNPKTGQAAKYYLYPEFEQADNYEITNADGELTVYPKPVKLEWTHEHAGQTEAVSGDQTFVYDGKLHKYTAKVSEDSYVYNPSGLPADREITVTLQANTNIQRDANVKTNTEKYTAYGAELSNPNYALVEIVKDGERTEKDVATRGQDFFIDQLPIELSWKPAEFTYNAQNQRPTATIENLQTNDEGVMDDPFTVTFTPETSIYADDYTATVTDLADKNYSELATPTDPESALVPTGTFAYTIKKAPLSIKSIAKTITYRDEAPKASEYELDVAGAGLQGDDTIENIGLDTSSLEFSCSYRKNDKPGSYAVVASMEAQELDNYTVNLENGTLQVNDKSLGLVARGLAKGKKKGKLSWNGVTGATSYEVWMAPCSSKSFKRVATVGGTSYVTKKLKKNKFYKFYIVANTPYGRIYSSESHFCTGNKAKKLTNAKSLKINAGSVGLNKGDSFTIGKSAKKAKKKLKFPGAKHGGNFRFMSDNPEVATVNGAGTITAVGSGWCRVYTQTTNGIWQVTEVYVY